MPAAFEGNGELFREFLEAAKWKRDHTAEAMVQAMARVKKGDVQTVEGVYEEEVISEKKDPDADKPKTTKAAVDVVTLKAKLTSDEDSKYLFFTRDDYKYVHYFLCLNKGGYNTLVGNAGTGKSWFQYRLLLFIFNPKLFKEVRPHDCKDDESGLQFDSLEHANLPKVIVRVNSSMANVFFVKDKVVLNARISDAKTILNFFSEAKSLAKREVLYLHEPDQTKEAALYQFLGDVQLLSTVSFDTRYYGNYSGGKGALLIYKGAHTPAELVAITDFLREQSQEIPSKEIVLERIRQCGPFLRQVVAGSGNYSHFLNQRKKAIGEFDTEIIRKIFKSLRVEDEKEPEVTHDPTHFVFTINPRFDTAEQAWTSYGVTFATKDIRQQLIDKRSELSPRDKMDIMRRVFNNEHFVDPVVRYYYEDVMEHLLTRGEGLKGWYFPLAIKVPRSKSYYGQGQSTSPRTPLEYFSLPSMSGPSTANEKKVNALDPDTLHRPADRHYAFSDMAWKAGPQDKFFKGSCRLQITAGKEHAKPYSAYRSMEESSGPPDCVIYAILPMHLEHWRPEGGVTRSFVFKNLNKHGKKVDSILKRVSFFCIIPDIGQRGTLLCPRPGRANQ